MLNVLHRYVINSSYYIGKHLFVVIVIVMSNKGLLVRFCFQWKEETIHIL